MKHVTRVLLFFGASLLCLSAFAGEGVIATCNDMLLAKDDDTESRIWTKLEGPSVSIIEKSDGILEAKFRIEYESEFSMSEVRVKDYAAAVAAEILFTFDQESELHKVTLNGMKEYQVLETQGSETASRQNKAAFPVLAKY